MAISHANATSRGAALAFVTLEWVVSTERLPETPHDVLPTNASLTQTGGLGQFYCNQPARLNHSIICTVLGAAMVVKLWLEEHHGSAFCHSIKSC